MTADQTGASPERSAYKALSAATIGMTLGYSVVGFAAFGLFVLPLTQAFGWGRGDVSVAFTIMSYGVALVVPIFGFVIDRFGARRILLPSIILFAASLASLSSLDGNLMAFYAIYMLIAVSGAGTTPAVYTRVVVQWFDRRRGLALGVALCGPGIGAALLPPILQLGIAELGWRHAYLVLGVAIVAITFPICFLWFREPTDRQRAAMDAGGDPLRLEMGQSFAEAVRGRIFWQMAGAFFMLGMLTAGVMAHLVPMLRDRGASAEEASAAVSLLGVAVIVGRVATGYFLDRLFAPAVIGICLAAAIFGLLALTFGSDGPVAFVAILLIGLAVGSELDFMSYLVSRYHGIRAYARIYGVLYGIFTAGAGIGPLLMGYGHQLTGAYTNSLILLTGLTTLATILLISLGRYPGKTAGAAA